MLGIRTYFYGPHIDTLKEGHQHGGRLLSLKFCENYFLDTFVLKIAIGPEIVLAILNVSFIFFVSFYDADEKKEINCWSAVIMQCSKN